MQPITPPEVVLLMHREMIEAELEQQVRRQERTFASRSRPVSALRGRIGHALVAIGQRIDPTARPMSRPGA